MPPGPPIMACDEFFGTAVVGSVRIQSTLLDLICAEGESTVRDLADRESSCCWFSDSTSTPQRRVW